MHLTEFYFLKNDHPVTYSPGLCGHKELSDVFLGLKLERDYFFENPRGPKKISWENPKYAAATPTCSEPRAKVIHDIYVRSNLWLKITGKARMKQLK